jgi:hypothetical protein
MELDTLIERTQAIRDALPVPSVKQRLASAAAELSLATSNQARVELLNEAVMSATNLCYQVDADGVFCNIDRRTHRLLFPAPWGKAGWRKWGEMREWEATILRQILIVRCQMQRVIPLFDFNGEGRAWHINLQDYPRLDLALLYWKKTPITLAEWRLHADAYRQRAHERTLRNAGK